MVKKTLLIILILLLIAGIVMFLIQKQPKKPSLTEPIPVTTSPPLSTQEIVDYQASFAIFTNGTFRIFTAPMYHNLSPEVYIQSDSPNVVNVKKSGLTWDDFFKTLPFKLSKDCLTTGTGQTFCSGQNGKLKFYLNGVIEEDLLNKTISHGDQILISFGNENETEIQQQFQQIPKVSD